MSSWEDNVRRVEPYVPGEQPKEKDIIKLNTNENPYPPTPRVAEVIRDFDAAQLRKYPDPTIADLVGQLSQTYGVPTDQIFVGVGSDDVLALSFLTFFHGDTPILFPDVTYSFYDVWADVFEIPYRVCPLDKDFSIRKEDYFTANGGIVIANPNAPTGLLCPTDALCEIVKKNPDSVVIIDEAYGDFSGTSMLPYIDTYDNLLVVRTFSKSRSLAGSRIGFAFGSKKLMGFLNDVKYSFNSYTMDSLSIAVGVASLKDNTYFEDRVNEIIATREWAKKKLRDLGFSFPDSSANFIFATHPSVPAKELYEKLRQRKIFVRHFDKPRMDNYLRISVGTREEMEQLIAALKDMIS